MNYRLLFWLVYYCIAIAIGGCSIHTVSSEPHDYQLSKLEEDALGHDLVMFYSSHLPNYVYDVRIFLAEDLPQAKSRVLESINVHGVVVGSKEIDGGFEIVARVGSGAMNANPAGLIVKLFPDGNGTKLFIRAVAKEGWIKQNTSEKAAERLISDMEASSKLKTQRY